jgi:hypothetical protein
VEAPERGEFATVGIIAPGRKLRLNCCTKRAGSVLVEAADLAGKPLAGRSFAEAVPIVGDHRAAAVVWRETQTIGDEEGAAIILRFRLDKAQLFWVEFY